MCKGCLVDMGVFGWARKGTPARLLKRLQKPIIKTTASALAGLTSALLVRLVPTSTSSMSAPTSHGHGIIRLHNGSSRINATAVQLAAHLARGTPSTE